MRDMAIQHRRQKPRSIWIYENGQLMVFGQVRIVKGGLGHVLDTKVSTVGTAFRERKGYMKDTLTELKERAPDFFAPIIILEQIST